MRIAQWVPTLTFGGVETYLVRLTRAMVELGHEVTLLSESGELSALLAGSGVNWVTLPADERRFDAAAEALTAHRCEVLNAHNYRAGRWAQQVSGRTGVPWILSIHGPRSALHRLANHLHHAWPPLVITTSAGDRDNVCGLFGIAPQRVRVSTQVIDPAVYRPHEVPPSGDGPLIVHVSRFSNRKAEAALGLLAALPALREEVPGTRLVLVGGGSQLPQVQAALARLTAEHGPVASLEAQRLDLSDLWCAAAVGVATATTAMEAMACGTPLIAAGRTGYLGPVSSANFARGLDLLFADHGHCPARTTPERLLADLVPMLTRPAAYRAEALALSQRLHAEFNPRAVAANVVTIYEELLSRTARR